MSSLPITKPDPGELNWNVDLDAALDTLESEVQSAISAAAAAQVVADQAATDASTASTAAATAASAAATAQSAANTAATTAATALTNAATAQTTANGAVTTANTALTTANSKIDSTQLATKEPLVTAGTTSQYYRGDKSWQTLNKTAVGLANVDNTTDLLKPISTATQNALNLRETIFVATGDDSDIAAAIAEAPVGWTGFVAIQVA